MDIYFRNYIIFPYIEFGVISLGQSSWHPIDSVVCFIFTAYPIIFLHNYNFQLSLQLTYNLVWYFGERVEPTRVGQYKTRVEVADSDKLASLLNYGRKKNYVHASV